VYPFGKALEAFKQMERSPHSGIFVLEHGEESVLVGEPVAMCPLTLGTHGVYIVFGGLGGLGLSIAEFLVQHGAKKIGLVSRSGVPRVEALKLRLERLKQTQGIIIYTSQLDICDYANVRNFTAWATVAWGCIEGAIHAAGALRVSNINTVPFFPTKAN
jgi:short-subunit dehydrogenase involved in D-alanine esterification of teichoic acids